MPSLSVPWPARQVVFQHGIGGSQDLPVPLGLALTGGAAALAVSFIVLALAWRAPRFDAASQGVPVPGLQRIVEAPAYVWSLRALGLLGTVYVGWAALAGPDNLANPTFGVLFVLLWVGLVPASLVFGPAYRAVNPVRTLHALLSRLVGGDPSSGLLPYPDRLGLWPAAFGLLGFVWFELVFPDNNFLWSVRLWLAAYAVFLLVGAAVFGDRWIASADPFEVYSTLVGRLSVWGRTGPHGEGPLVVRGPLRNLDGTPPVAGLVGVVAVLIGSTAWDSFQDSLAWARFTGRLTVGPVVAQTTGLVLACVVVGLLFAGATLLARPVIDVSGLGRDGRGDHGDPGGRGAMPALLAHSLVPIVVGYVTAHYLTYLLETGQQTLIYLSDPMVDGANYLGTADLQVSYWLSVHPTLLAWLKVGAIVGGHVLGVIAAHDRSLRVLPRRDQLTGQLPLLAVMVGYTLAGLYLLLTV